MAEITSSGYQDLRDYIEDNWDHIELRDDNGDQILRLSPSDSRVSWLHSSGDQVLSLEIIISGSDSDISLPQVFSESAIYKVSSSGSAFSVESFTDFTMESEKDKLTIVHEIEVPKV